MSKLKPLPASLSEIFLNPNCQSEDLKVQQINRFGKLECLD